MIDIKFKVPHVFFHGNAFQPNAFLLWLMQDDDVGAIESLKKTLQNCAFYSYCPT
jgi:hypothetical protein